MHKLSSFVCDAVLWLGEVGDAEGTMPSGEHFPLEGWLSASLSPA